MSLPRHRTIDIEWPEYGQPEAPPRVSAAELRRRLEAARAAMERKGFTHLAVYGDREHFANLAYLTGFDPRFEEALLLLRQSGPPLLLLGNECMGYVKISPLLAEGGMRIERFQPFSLVNQPRGQSRELGTIFADEGIGPGARVGCVGWKDYSGEHAIDAPSYLVDALRELAGFENVRNAAALFLDPEEGLRTFCSPGEIAWFEYANMLASDGVRSIVRNLREGLPDHELVKFAQYNGVPLATYLTLKCGQNRTSLSSPRGATLERGGVFSVSICYWGGHSCRAGWAAAGATELPGGAQDYVASFAGPYLEAMNEWFRLLRIGAAGGTLEAVIQDRLPFERFGVFLNAGHLMHLDEWVSSPMYPGSQARLHSGMMIQSDVIPSSPVYYSTRMEDGLVLADASLQARLLAEYPHCYRRCLVRREFMRGALGLAVSDDVLPLSNIAGMVWPYFLRPQTILAME